MPMELTIDQALQQGVKAHRDGKLQEAEKLYRAILEAQPLHPDGNHNLGLIALALDRFDESFQLFKNALEAKPQIEQFWLSYLEALVKGNQFETAKEILIGAEKAGFFGEKFDSLSQQLQTPPRGSLPPTSDLTRLLKYYQTGKCDEAEKLAAVMTQRFPRHHFGWKILGALAGQRGRMTEALYANERAVKLVPEDAEANNNLGVTLQELGRLDKAKASYTKALVLRPDYAEAHNNLGVTLRELGRLDEAEASYTQALALKPDYAEALNNLGDTLKELGRYDEAERNLRQAIALKPAFAEVHGNLGNMLEELGRSKESEASYKQAIALQPDYAEAHHDLSFTLLKNGKLKEGLDEYEWRWKLAKNLPKNRLFPQPLWDGSRNLKGKRILLWCEQGIGDTLNWSSCLPLVAAQAEHTIVECQEKLIPLLARSFPNVEIKPENRSLDSQRDDFDLHLPMGSLYRHFMQKIGQNSNVDAYLVPDSVRVNFWRDRLNSLGKSPFIGVCWKSSVVNPFRLKHYPPISEWYSVLSIPEVTFINLQYADFADDLTKIQNDIGVKVHNFDDLDQYNDVDDVAALCAALDMVVSTKVTPLIFSSGVGTSTKIANWRQSVWNNVITNPVSSSVDMFERNTWEPWDNVFKLIAEDIFKFKNKIIQSGGKL